MVAEVDVNVDVNVELVVVMDVRACEDARG